MLEKLKFPVIGTFLVCATIAAAVLIMARSGNDSSSKAFETLNNLVVPGVVVGSEHHTSTTPSCGDSVRTGPTVHSLNASSSDTPNAVATGIKRELTRQGWVVNRSSSSRETEKNGVEYKPTNSGFTGDGLAVKVTPNRATGGSSVVVTASYPEAC